MRFIDHGSSLPSHCLELVCLLSRWSSNLEEEGSHKCLVRNPCPTKRHVAPRCLTRGIVDSKDTPRRGRRFKEQRPARRHPPLRVSFVKWTPRGCKILEANLGRWKETYQLLFVCLMLVACSDTCQHFCIQFKILPLNRGAGGVNGQRTTRAGVG